MSRSAMILLMASAFGCGANPTPPPVPPHAKTDEVPIRTDAEIARDQASSTPVTDPAICTTRPNTLGCPASGGKKAGPFDNNVHRNPRLLKRR
ncbi:MAG: hypothetical protein ABI461_23030 [Polyangiaceae bacterium]